jgi:hypothetical protein
MSASAARAFPERLPLRRRSLLLAQMRSGGCIEQCPMLRANRKTYARTEFFSV